MYLLLTGIALAFAPIATPNDLPGHYTLDRTASEDPSAVIEAALRDVGPMRRGRMRTDLLRQVSPAPSLVIRAAESGFSITDSSGRELRAVPGAPAARITTPQGQPATLEAMVRDDALVLRVTGGRGGREQVFAADTSGLTITSTYTVAALDAPIRLRSVYRRESR